jgi:hypothetical protein
MVAPNDNSGGIIVPISANLDLLRKGLEEVKRIGANPDLLKITPTMSFNERMVTQEVNRAIIAMQREAAKQQARVMMFGEAKVEVKVVTKDQQIQQAMDRIKEDIRTKAEQAKIEVEAKVRIKSERDEAQSIVNPSRFARQRMVENRGGFTQAVRGRQAEMIRGMADAGDGFYVEEAAIAGVYGDHSQAMRRFRVQNRSASERGSRAARAAELRASREIDTGELLGFEESSAALAQRMRGGMPITSRTQASSGINGANVIGGLTAALYAGSKFAERIGPAFSPEGRHLRAQMAQGGAMAGMQYNQQAYDIHNFLTLGAVSGVDAFVGFKAQNEKNMADLQAKLQGQAAASARAHSMRPGVESALLASRGDEVGAIRSSGEASVSDVGRVLIEAGVQNYTKDPMYLKAQKIADAAVRDAQEQRAANIRGINNAGNFATSGSEIVTLQQLGRGDEAFAKSQALDRQKLVATQQDRLVGVKDQEKRSSILATNEQELYELDVRQWADAQDRKKQKAIDTNTAIAATEEATLRTSRRNYEADLSAFDAETKAKLDGIKDLDAKQNESQRRAAARQVLVFHQQQELNDTLATYRTAGAVATLRARRENQAADVKAFDDETKLQADNIDAAKRDGYLKSRAEQRAALLSQQGQERTNVSESLRTRTDQANASARGYDDLAGLIGVLASQRAERRNITDATDPTELSRAQRAELQAIQSSILRPRGYLSTTDARSEIAGGPGGQQGDQMLKILELINKGIDDLNRKEDPGAILK